MPDKAHLFYLSGDEWGCSACGNVKHLDTLEPQHKFPRFCDECGAEFDPPEFKARARYGWFYSPDERALVRLSRAPSKRTNAGCCPDCGSPVPPVRGGSSPHVRQCPICYSYYRGVKVERG